MKKIGFLSFGHWTPSPQSKTRSAADALLQSMDLAVAAEELGADGAYFRVHHFARQLASPFPLLAAVGAKTRRIEIGTAVIDMRYENPLYMAEDAGAADLIAGRAAVALPVLRKDFTFDPYQLVEARVAGADAVLLIVAVVPDRLAELGAEARALGLDVLVEVHDARELELALRAGADLIGINNRNLRDFSIDLATTERLRPAIPPGIAVVGESGVETPADMRRMAAAQVDAVLIGSALMRSADPGAQLAALRAAAADAIATQTH